MNEQTHPHAKVGIRRSAWLLLIAGLILFCTGVLLYNRLFRWPGSLVVVTPDATEQLKLSQQLTVRGQWYLFNEDLRYRILATTESGSAGDVMGVAVQIENISSRTHRVYSNGAPPFNARSYHWMFNDDDATVTSDAMSSIYYSGAIDIPAGASVIVGDGVITLPAESGKYNLTSQVFSKHDDRYLRIHPITIVVD